MSTEALRVEHLEVVYTASGRDRRVISDLSLGIRPGESYGLVGESGCGKSTLALAAVRYLARNGRVSRGRILIDGRDLWRLSAGELRRLRARSVSMVYQDPARALNPSLRIATQMAEVFEASGESRGPLVRERCLRMLERVQIPDPERTLQAFPHELSGGQQQRVVIAMALSNDPSLLILDEPTTGLDATVEAEVLELITRLRAQSGVSLLFISHSLAVISRMCDRIGVLYAGELVEEGSTREVLGEPRHPYTVALLRCIPDAARRKQHGRLETIPGFLPLPGSVTGRCVFADRCGNVTERCRSEVPPALELPGERGIRLTRCFFPERATGLPHASDGAGTGEQVQAGPGSREDPAARPLLRARNLSKTYGSAGHAVRVLSGVELEIWPGETLGLVGESGSGKSSLGRLLLGLSAPDPGSELQLDGQPLAASAARRTRAQRRALQVVFQNPGLALNRSQTIRRLIERSLRVLQLPRRQRESRLLALLSSVRLAQRHLDDRPRQLSGGLQQRVSIARAFAGEPRLVICDEPTSALDVSVQAAILNLLSDLQSTQRVSYLFISHDLNVVRYISDRVAVLYHGRLLEVGPTERVFAGPQHPYTESLLSTRPPAVGPPGSGGCVFRHRCPRRLGPICDQEPPMQPDGSDHLIRCHIEPAELGRLQHGPGDAGAL